ncbi:STM4012 family radical SAM protein [Gynuella sp.]|uniref:STM4012 family radical SAM protein n=1 Tax=Gynuella sp. TaxID=2969146 RepID=UPI003D0E5A83
MPSVEEVLGSEIYRAYAYSYPHKSAYRALSNPTELEPLWASEKRDSLFLYVHIPYCQMRCGFCNLFTLVRPNDQQVEVYIEALLRQIETYSAILNPVRFARFALGGGTPTFLTQPQLQRLMEALYHHFGLNLHDTPATIECSPGTIDQEKVTYLNSLGTRRISIGIQSFIEQETRNLARPQSPTEAHAALETIRTHSASELNIDLIYGIDGQTEQSWRYSIEAALNYLPEELYLYPLYIRKLTGLDKIKKNRIASDRQSHMLKLYRLAREQLLSAGYEQVSMRMFRRQTSTSAEQPIYTCQQDGMVGLGAGARSYTRNVHYSSEYAVGRHDIKSIIEHYSQMTADDFRYAGYGVTLNEKERQRRFVIQSLLLAEGLSLRQYTETFRSQVINDLPELAVLAKLGLTQTSDLDIRLTETGLERADMIGDWLISKDVRQRMQGFELR